MSGKEGGQRKRITLADIASACGVSSMTVSLALRKHPKISEKTRDRVLAKAEELGYRPDPVLSALNHYRSHQSDKRVQATLAWINPYHDPKRLRAMREFDLYWQGAQAAAQRMGYNLEAFATTQMSFARMDTVFKTRNIQGILLAALCRPQFSDKGADFSEMPWADYAIVRFGRSAAFPEAHYVTSAQTRNTLLAFEKIKEKGYQRIGFVSDDSPTKTFCGGAALSQLSMPKHQRLPFLRFPLGEDSQTRRHRLIQWFQEEEPDAILTDNPLVLDILKGMGLRIPDDVALATTTVHDTPIDAGMNQNPEEIGRTAVRTLISLINEQSFGVPSIRNEVLIEGDWVDGSMMPDKRGD